MLGESGVEPGILKLEEIDAEAAEKIGRKYAIIRSAKEGADKSFYNIF